MSTGKAVLHYVRSDGGSWVKFLQKKLQEKQYDIPTEEHEMREPCDTNSDNDVNVALVTPDFLLMDTYECLEHCKRESSLAVLLGCDETEFKQIASVRNAKSVPKWTCYQTEQTQDSVKGLLMTIISLYENLFGGDELDEADETEDSPLYQLLPPVQCEGSSADSDDLFSGYSRLPPPRQVNSLHDVWQLCHHEEDGDKEILVLLDRWAESDLVLTCTGYTGEPIKTQLIEQAVYKAKVDHKRIKDGKLRFVAVCKDQIFGSKEVNFNETLRDKQSLKTVPDDPSPQPKSNLDKIRELLEEETDPISVLCQAMQIPRSDHDQFDHKLSVRCRNLRITDNFSDLMTQESNKGRDTEAEWPTLLHFCADNNLLQSTNELLMIPSFVAACLRCNKNRETPKDIAKRKGFADMASLLEKRFNEHVETVKKSRDADSGIWQRGPYRSAPSMRENSCRSIDSGVSEMPSEPSDRESDWLDPAGFKTRDSTKRVYSHPLKHAMSIDSLQTDRASGTYANELDFENALKIRQEEQLRKALYTEIKMKREGKDQAVSRSFSDSYNPVKDESLGSTWYVEDDNPSNTYPRRRSDSDVRTSLGDHFSAKQNVKGARNSKGTFMKSVSKVFKLKRKNSISTNQDATIPEEVATESIQTPKEERRESGFPCRSFELSETYENIEKELEQVQIFEPPKVEPKLSKKEKKKLEREESLDITKSKSKKTKKTSRKKIDRRKSVRVSRVLKDTNVTVLELPSKQVIQV